MESDCNSPIALVLQAFQEKGVFPNPDQARIYSMIFHICRFIYARLYILESDDWPSFWFP